MARFLKCMTSLILALSLSGAESILCAAEPSATSHSTVPASANSEKLQEVTVIANRIELEKRVSRFVNQIAARENEEGLPRWQKPVCPSVSGLPRQEGEFVLGRVSEIARDAGVPLAAEHCRPNFFVIVTPDIKKFLGDPKKWSGMSVFGTPQAVRVWYSPYEVDAWGMPLACSVMGYPAPCFAEASRVVSNVEWEFWRVFVIVDQTRLHDVSRGQFADYVALVGLAELKPNAKLGDASTVLKLFDGAPKAAPAGLTDWDQNFLKSLYSTEARSKLQRSQIARSMVREIAP
jgi:hypothetical protein